MKRQHARNGIIATVVLSILAIALILTTTYSLLIAIQQVSRDNENYIFGYKPIIVISGSMEPAIMTNSISIVKKCSVEDVKLGDIIMYKADSNILITHRVIDIIYENNEKQLITKGDSNTGSDVKPITNDNIKAKVVYTANYVTDIISNIMPAPGMINTLALVKGIMFLILGIVVLAFITTIIIRLVQTTYSAVLGENRIDNIISVHGNSIDTNRACLDTLKIYEKNIRTNINIIDKIVIGIRKARIVYHLKDIEKATKKLNKSMQLYSLACDNATIGEGKKNKNIGVIRWHIYNNIDKFIYKDVVMEVLDKCENSVIDSKRLENEK